MDIALQSLDYFTDDRSWLGSDHGTDDCESITLDMSKFTKATHFPNGFVVSGLALAKITSSGLYAPYGGRANETQTLTRTSTGGTVDLTWDGETVVGVVATAAGFTAAAVQTKLETLSNVNPGDVAVTGVAGGPLTVTFTGRYAGTDVPAIAVDNTNATGGTIVQANGTVGGSTFSNGQETGVGHLFTAAAVHRDTAMQLDNTVNVAGALFTHGKVRTANLPANHGVDAAFRAAVPLIRYI